MLLAENFVQVIINGYYTSNTIVGQQLIYNSKNQNFEAIRKRKTRIFLKMRLILLSLISIATIVRIIDVNLQIKSNRRQGNHSVETNMCIMILFMLVLIGERYRIRSKFPNDYVKFLNGAIAIEKSYGIGTK